SLSRPGPESASSYETYARPRASTRRIAISRSLPGASAIWPASVGSTWAWPARGSSTAEPSPVPGPITSTGPRAAGCAVSITGSVSSTLRNWVAQAELLAQRGDRHRPGQVLVDDRVVQHHAGAGHHAAADAPLQRGVAGDRQLRHEIAQQAAEVGPVGAVVAVVVQHADRLAVAGGAEHQADARMGAAD